VSRDVVRFTRSSIYIYDTSRLRVKSYTNILSYASLGEVKNFKDFTSVNLKCLLALEYFISVSKLNLTLWKHQCLSFSKQLPEIPFLSATNISYIEIKVSSSLLFIQNYVNQNTLKLKYLKCNLYSYKKVNIYFTVAFMLVCVFCVVVVKILQEKILYINLKFPFAKIKLREDARECLE
jgi:hypothetical protein